MTSLRHHCILKTIYTTMELRTPKEITEATVAAGCRKVETMNSMGRFFMQSVMAGCYISLGGILSVIVGFGFPGLTAENPSLQRLLSGCMFPVGLILVVVLGAELFTGNNALLVPAYMKGHYGAWKIAKNWTLVYLGNLVGALAFTYLFVYYVGLTASSPYHEAVTGIAKAKISMPWLTVLVKGIGANWCVCLAVWLALSGHTLVNKIMGCWWPVMAFVVFGYEHSIANMFFIPCGMLEGAEVTVGDMILSNLVPATIGNILGGALFVGCVQGYIHLKK